MGTIHRLLTRLTLNRQFVEDFISADVPCFAMGVVEERKSPCAFLALRTAETIPSDISDGGFNFGHSVFGNSQFEVVHFAFEFYDFQTFNVLVNPNNLLVQTVLSMMIESGEYFFFALDPGNAVTAFKSEIQQDNLLWIKANLHRIKGSKTTERQYARAISSFVENPEPAGIMLNWVCRDKVEYLDLTGDTIELNPARAATSTKAEGSKENAPIFRDITWLPQVREALDGMDEDTADQIRNFEEGLTKPHVLDDYLMNRAIRLMKERAEFYFPYAEQLSQWLSLDLDPDRRREVERLIEVNQRVRAGSERAIELCERITEGTIDRIMEKDDFELGVEAFLGKRNDFPEINTFEMAGLKIPSLPAPLQRFEAALAIHEFVESIQAAGGSEEDIAAHPDMMDFMMQFRGIMDKAQPGEMDSLTQMFSGFHRFAELLENLAQIHRRSEGYL